MTTKRKYIIPIAIVTLLLLGYFTIDSFLFDGIKPQSITENGFQGNYFTKDDLANKPAILLIGGGEWGDYWAQEFANKEMVGLSIPYAGHEHLPRLPEEINLEYFENAITWLGNQHQVNADKIIVMGASRNAELALVIASTFPELISGVIAYAPSSVSWSNTVLPYNSDDIKASWTYRGSDIPYVPMEKISGNDSDKIKMLDYWENGLSKTDRVNKAAIKVERIKGPVLLFSGIDDKVWPSALMADMIEKRLKENKFKYAFKNIKYENAGHLISGNPEQNSNVRVGKISVDGKNYEYEFGGTEDGDSEAKNDAYSQVFELMENLKND